MCRVTRVVLVVFLAFLAVAACRPDGPTGVLPPTLISITLSPDAAEVPVDGSVQLEATVRDEDGEIVSVDDLTWSSSDESLARVSASGEVTGLALGTVEISAAANGASGTAEIQIRGFLIGPEGGQATSEDGGAEVEVPSGALAENVAVTLEPANQGSLPSGPDDRAAAPGAAYALEAGQQSFSKPVKLQIRYDPGSLPSDVPENTLRLMRAQNGQWLEIQGSERESGAPRVSGDVTVSGVFAVVGRRDQPPQVSISAPESGSRFFWGTQVAFSGTATDGIDGSLSGSSLVWSSSRDGDLGTGREISRANLSIGEHAITLSATNGRGRTGSAQITVHIDNNPPEAEITNPADGSVFFRNSPVQFRGAGTDPEEGRLQGGSLVWSSSRDGEFGTGENVTTNSLSAGEHTITLTATDSRGATGTAQIRIRILALF